VLTPSASPKIGILLNLLIMGDQIFFFTEISIEIFSLGKFIGKVLKSSEF
jgi:hypothetical protein